MEEKVIAIRVQEDLHRELKIKLATEGITLKDYIVNLIKKDLSPEGPEERIARIREYSKQIEMYNNMILDLSE